jgi:hypothetical protein
LRPGYAGDLVVDVARLDGEWRRRRQEIANLGEEGLVGGCVMGLAAPVLQPLVNRRLQGVATIELCLDSWREPIEQARKTRKQSLGRQSGAGESLLNEKVVKLSCYLHSRDLNAAHVVILPKI